MKQDLLQGTGLPSFPHIIYEHPPLALALCQIKFARVLGINERVGRFQDEIAEQFPFAGAGEQIEIEVGTSSQGLVKPPRRQEQWRFSDAQNIWTVALTNDSVALETRIYEDFQVFLTRLNYIITALLKTVKPKVLTRIGLRYINEIRLYPSPATAKEWEAYINPELLGPLSVQFIGQKAIAAQQQVLLRYKDDQGINLNHALLADGTTVAPQPDDEAPNGPFYLLDFDVFRDFPPVRQQSFIAHKIVEHIREYNQIIYRLFRWSVTDAYIVTLRERL